MLLATSGANWVHTTQQRQSEIVTLTHKCTCAIYTLDILLQERKKRPPLIDLRTCCVVLTTPKVCLRDRTWSYS